ncbi:DUF928 domain-containing protein [Pseudanabaena galeata UHCC 0370]|jgi:hypothetical protein|uniref:DUF928 domain-containing protein n=1 Tax=Pseudanabaena galeata UHCC 0370 TaxID=3110310 RepID=A0ABU5TMZ5_9CYAN|nr:DUF928 domain-containing protein [Pseudanabaena galeata]MEA5479645.1 DUF928 domain-containing protein [Pseudanabaena galeata UHCC 0370]
MKILSQTRFLRTMVLMACAIAAMPSQSITAQTIPTYDPPPPTDPTIRGGGNCSTFVPELLSPLSKKAITMAVYPTFLFLVPTTTARQVQFSIRDRSKSIYRQTFSLSGQAGILRVALPNAPIIKELSTEKSYKWEFSIICDPVNRHFDDFVVGELQRVALVEAKSPSQLALWERYRAFEYDALMVLDLLRRSNPKDRLIQSEWESWLMRYKFGDLKELPAIK